MMNINPKYLNLLLIFIVFIIGSCSKDNWTKDEQRKFINECIDEGASKKYCKCFMKKSMEKYPIYEDSRNMKFEEAVELSKDCN